MLSLRRTQVRSLEGLQNLSNLVHLDLYWTGVRNLLPISKLRSLQSLSLQRTKVSDVSHLADLTQLSDLDLYWTSISNLAPLAGLTKLRRLNLERTNVFDLAPLANVTSLSDAAAEHAWYSQGLRLHATPAWAEIRSDPVIYGPHETIYILNNIRKKVGLEPYFPKNFVPTRYDLLETKNEDDAGSLQQRPASYSFELTEGKLKADPQTFTLKHSEIASDFHTILVEKAYSTVTKLRSSNAPARVQSNITALLKSLGANVDEVRPGVLLMRFRSVEADLFAFDTEEGRRELPEDLLSMVRDTASSTEDFMGCFPQLADIEAERLSQKLQQADIPEIVKHLEQILDAAYDSEAVVDSSAIQALEVGNEAISELTRTIVSPVWSSDTAIAIKARAQIVGQKLLDYRNFSASALRHAGKELNEVGEKTWVEVKAHAPLAIAKGVSKGLEKGTEAAVKVGIAGLVSSIGGGLAGIASLVVSFVPLEKKAREIERKQKSD
jgi:hypothetical protein